MIQGRELLGELIAEAVASADPDIAKRIGADPSAYLDLVALASAAHDETSALLRSAVLSARSAGQSWEELGQALDTTRQAAQQRFGKGLDEDLPTSAGTTRRLSPLTAFNEIEVLNRAGRHGWHSIGFGPLFHIVEKSDQQWEHHRVYAVGKTRRRAEASGWQRIDSMWFPWVYYKRHLDLPALPEPEDGIGP